MNGTLLLIRGLPGSGKTTLAHMFRDAVVLSADEYFVVDNEYRFDPNQLTEAHAQCQSRCLQALSEQRPLVVVANTFSQRWELEPYLVLAERWDYRDFVIDLFDGGMIDAVLAVRCVHGVPVGSISKMHDRWEHDWRSGDFRPPWERKVYLTNCQLPDPVARALERAGFTTAEELVQQGFDGLCHHPYLSGLSRSRIKGLCSSLENYGIHIPERGSV